VGVPEPGAVEVEGESARAGQGMDFFDLVKGEDRPAGAVVGVLQHHQPGGGIMMVARAQDSLDLRRGDGPAHTRQGAHLHPGESGGRAGLVMKDVAILFTIDFVARLGVALDGQLVALGAAADIEGGFFAKQCGHFFLEAVDRRVFAENVVAHLGGGHGRPHLGGGFGHSVAAQIDSLHTLPC